MLAAIVILLYMAFYFLPNYAPAESRCVCVRVVAYESLTWALMLAAIVILLFMAFYFLPNYAPAESRCVCACVYVCRSLCE